MATYTEKEVLSIVDGTEKNYKVINICVGKGAILHIQNLMEGNIVSYTKTSDGYYKREKVLNYSESLKPALLAMLHNHNYTPDYEKEASEFEINYPYNIG